MKREMEL